jgi:hypothetical protein
MRRMPLITSLTLLQRQAVIEKSYGLQGLTKTLSKGGFGEGTSMHYYCQIAKHK